MFNVLRYVKTGTWWDILSFTRRKRKPAQTVRRWGNLGIPRPEEKLDYSIYLANAHLGQKYTWRGERKSHLHYWKSLFYGNVQFEHFIDTES